MLHPLLIQELIAHDAPQRHKLCVHIVSEIDTASNDVIVTEQVESQTTSGAAGATQEGEEESKKEVDGLADVPPLKEVWFFYMLDATIFICGASVYIS